MGADGFVVWVCVEGVMGGGGGGWFACGKFGGGAGGLFRISLLDH